MPRLFRRVLGSSAGCVYTPTATFVSPDVLGGGDGGGVTTVGGLVDAGGVTDMAADGTGWGLKENSTRRDEDSHGVCLPPSWALVSCSTATRTCLNICSTGRFGSPMKRSRYLV